MTTNSIRVIVDRPLGSAHPKHADIRYPVNYGYVPGVFAGDGEEQDAYVLGVDHPLASFTGRLVALIHRRDDAEDKWVVAPESCRFTAEDIRREMNFMEKYFNSVVVLMED